MMTRYRNYPYEFKVHKNCSSCDKPQYFRKWKPGFKCNNCLYPPILVSCSKCNNTYDKKITDYKGANIPTKFYSMVPPVCPDCIGKEHALTNNCAICKSSFITFYKNDYLCKEHKKTYSQSPCTYCSRIIFHGIMKHISCCRTCKDIIPKIIPLSNDSISIDDDNFYQNKVLKITYHYKTTYGITNHPVKDTSDDYPDNNSIMSYNSDPSYDDSDGQLYVCVNSNDDIIKYYPLIKMIKDSDRIPFTNNIKMDSKLMKFYPSKITDDIYNDYFMIKATIINLDALIRLDS